METSILQNKMEGLDHKFRPFDRIADQLIHPAKRYREEGNMDSFHTTLDKYCWSRTGIAETRNQSILNEEKVGPASSVDSTTCRFPLRSLSALSFMAARGCWLPNLRTVTQSSPSPGISFIHTVPHAAEVSRITSADSVHGHSRSSCEGSTPSNVLKDVHLSGQLMEDFLELARDNTSKDLETCGVLGAFLKEGTFYVTILIIPKQESSSSSCQAINEEEIFAIQSEKSLFPVGWIHTHPSQSCFMSSIDLHTQYSYQIMVPEAVAIVMSPTDKSRGYGLFRISDPAGMSILRECQENGFHTHREPADGSSLYEHCSNVYINPNLRLEICDLR